MKNQDVSDDPTVWLGYKSTQAQPYDILLEKHLCDHLAISFNSNVLRNNQNSFCLHRSACIPL